MTGIGARRCGRLLPLAVFARILFPATWILTPHCRLSPIAAKRRNAAMPDSGYEPARAVARHTRACAGHDEGMTPATPSAVTLRQVYAATYDDVLRFVQRRCPASRAHDVAQEVFVVAWRRIGGAIVKTCGWGCSGGCLGGECGGFAFEEFALLEACAGADQGDQVGCVDRAPAVLGGLDELERHRDPGGSGGAIVETCGWGCSGGCLGGECGGFTFEEFALLEACAGADQGDQVGCVDRAPAVLGGLDELERHRDPGGSGARALGDALA